MREIKFKAWLESLQAMVSVHKIEFLDDGNYKIFFKNLQDGKYIDCALAPSSMISRSSAKGDRFALMQYTGVNDKNGKEIYTGFFVKWGLRIYEICFDCGFYMHDLSGINPEYPITKEFKEAPDEFEIIGNVYENPEILKDTK